MHIKSALPVITLRGKRARRHHRLFSHRLSMPWRKLCFVTVLVFSVFGLMPHLRSQTAVAQDTGGTPETRLTTPALKNEWSEPVRLSTTTDFSWFPDIAVDAVGRVHVVWDSGVSNQSTVLYTRREGQVWTTPIDVTPPQISTHINRAAVAVELSGQIHLTYNNGSLRHSTVDTAHAGQALAWQHSLPLSSFTYMSDVEIDGKGVIHTIYDNWVATGFSDQRLGQENYPEQMADIYYRRSVDGGQNWSPPTRLLASPKVGSARAQLEIDRQGTLHAAWDEGWDRQTLYGAPEYGVYMNSQDGGLTWSAPFTVTYPSRTNAQLTVGADGKGGVLLVWRATDDNALFFIWSDDNGKTWTPAKQVPTFFARPWTTPFDAYDMEADSAGRIHLLAVGQDRLPSSADDTVPLGVYHLVWDGKAWSKPSPVAVYEQDLYPEYPKLDISQGNRLHVVWFVRDDLWTIGDYQVWYSESQVDAPFEPSPPTPTPPPTPTATPPPTKVATETPVSLSITPGPINVSVLYTENDELVQALLAAAPILMIAVIFYGFRKLRDRKR